MSMRDYSEKRDFHRMQVNSDIEISDGEGNAFTAVCRDLSGTGMQLYTERPVAGNTELYARLPSTSDQFPPFETVVRVLRCEPEGEGYLLGVIIEQVKH